MTAGADIDDAGLLPGEVRLVPVDARWAERFAQAREALAQAFGPAALDIQHVGSTAVPGLWAKPVLDIAVAIASFDAGHAHVAAVERLGYLYRGEHGIARRHYFVRGTPRRTHHLHVLERDSSDWQRHLAFRDRLRAFPALAARYAALKHASVAAAEGDRARYQALKRDFIATAVADPAWALAGTGAS